MIGRPGATCCPSIWTRFFLSSILTGILLSTPATAATWYVDAAALPGGDGSETAPFSAIHPATDVAQFGDVVRLAAGTYSQFASLQVAGQPRLALLVLPDGVRVRGAGVGQTILHAEPAASVVFGITAAEVGPGAQVSDLTITGACVQGVNLRGASPTLERLQILNDVTGGSSLAMDVREGSAPAVRDVLFDGGHASLFIEFESGGVYEDCVLAGRQNETLAITNSDPFLRRCVIGGGGRDTIVFNQGGAPILRDCTIEAGARWTVRVFGFTPGSTIDVRQNRWFTEDVPQLEAAILDANDNALLGARVLFEPLLPPVSNRARSFGAIKAAFGSN